MLWFRFLFLCSLVLFNSVQAVITLAIGKNALIGTPIDVSWTRERGDSRSFDLHKFSNGEDYGFVAHVDARKGENRGRLSVNFDEQGSFTLRAFDFEESQQPLAETPAAVNVKPFGEAPNPADPTNPDATTTGVDATPAPTDGSTVSASTSTITTPASSTSSSSTAPTGSPSNSATSASSKPPRINAAAIAGGVIGGTVLIALIILGIVLLIRRRRANKDVDRRFSFYRDLMVQARPTAVSHAQQTSLAGEIIPRIPRFSFQRRREPAAPSAAPLAHSFTPAHAGPTERQLQLNARVRQLEEMMHEIRYRPGMSRVLEQLRVQVSWLRAQRNSPWALHQTDDKPTHYELYMTS